MKKTFLGIRCSSSDEHIISPDAEVPPRVEYSLSEMGEKFRKVLDQIELFGLEYIEELKKCDALKKA